MWFVRMFFLLVVFVMVLGFALLNNEKYVEIAFFFPKESNTYEVHLIFALFGAFVAGMLVWFFLSIGHDIRVRRDASRLPTLSTPRRCACTADSSRLLAWWVPASSATASCSRPTESSGGQLWKRTECCHSAKGHRLDNKAPPPEARQPHA